MVRATRRLTLAQFSSHLTSGKIVLFTTDDETSNIRLGAIRLSLHGIRAEEFS